MAGPGRMIESGGSTKLVFLSLHPCASTVSLCWVPSSAVMYKMSSKKGGNLVAKIGMLAP